MELAIGANELFDTEWHVHSQGGLFRVTPTGPPAIVTVTSGYRGPHWRLRSLHPGFQE